MLWVIDYQLIHQRSLFYTTGSGHCSFDIFCIILCVADCRNSSFLFLANCEFMMKFVVGISPSQRLGWASGLIFTNLFVWIWTVCLALTGLCTLFGNYFQMSFYSVYLWSLLSVFVYLLDEVLDSTAVLDILFLCFLTAFFTTCQFCIYAFLCCWVTAPASTSFVLLLFIC